MPTWLGSSMRCTMLSADLTLPRQAPGDARLKRLVDIVCALGGLLLLVPLLVAVALAVLLDDGRPVLFRQERIGRNGKRFDILKFRSMRAHPHEAGPLITAAGDARLTRVGQVIRGWKLDELPQLVNVLRGEMTLVGPRPEVPRYVAHYSDAQRAVLALTPGITDPASLAFLDEERQLAAARDPERFYLDHAMPTKIALNLDYARTATCWSDLGVVIRTVMAIADSRRCH